MMSNSPAAYSVLNPHPVLAKRTPEGHITDVYFTDKPGYIDLPFLRALAAEGAITIHEVGGNDLAEQYGRTRVVYSVN